MRKKPGFTLIETLISLALLMILLGLVYGGLRQFMQAREYLDTTTSAQAKLRRVLEVVTQDLRSAVFGAITDTPYTSNQSAVSFALLGKKTDDGDYISQSGYKVISPAVPMWEMSFFTVISSPNVPDLEAGDYIMLVSPTEKKGVIMPLTTAPVPTIPGKWMLTHLGCPNTVSYTPDTMVFPVVLYGIRYDADKNELLLKENSQESPLAFDIDDFKVEYLPNRNEAKQLRVTLKTKEQTRSREIEREYTSIIDLYSNASFEIEEVVSCSP